MYQYRNLPPRHQPPGFYPPHQPSLRHTDTTSLSSSPPHRRRMHDYGLTRSHSHGLMQSQRGRRRPRNPRRARNGYRTHHITPPHRPNLSSSPDMSSNTSSNTSSVNGADASLFAMQQMQRIKAATACQIIQKRVVEAIRQQQEGKRKTRKPSDHQDSSTQEEESVDEEDEEEESCASDSGSEQRTPHIIPMLDTNSAERMMTIPQLEISSAPRSTANLTNLSEDDLKQNPELYKRYSYYIPFATRQDASSTNTSTSSISSNSPPRTRTHLGPRRRPYMNHKYRSHSYSPNKQKHKLIPIGQERPNPMDKQRMRHPQIAPAHANVQSVISPNGGIYHPCHGYSTREISIFDLFPGIVKYQSKKYVESDRVDYLVTLSDKPFISVNYSAVHVDEAEMWYTALKYLFNDITLGQFDYMSVEMRYVIKQYMSTHKSRLSFLQSIKKFGFLRTISDISKKLPREHIQKVMKEEEHKKEKLRLQQLQKQLAYEQAFRHHFYQQQLQLYAAASGHVADWYNGGKLKRTTSEPSSIKPRIIDNKVEENEEEEDGLWDDIARIVDEHKIPDLPPESMNDNSKMSTDEEEEKKDEVYNLLYSTMKEEEEDKLQDVFAGILEDEEPGPQITMEQLTSLDTSLPTHDPSFIPKLPLTWCNANVPSSIWMDNPYTKPSKCFEKKRKKKKCKTAKVSLHSHEQVSSESKSLGSAAPPAV